MLRCRGKSYLDLLAQRAGDCEGAPDAVVRPADHEQVAAVLRVCAEARRRGRAVRRRHERRRRARGAARGLRRASSRSTSGGWTRVEAVDERSLTAVLGPGLRLPEAERALGAHGLRLAHVPQSYEWATVGGCVATRSAGQSSTGHGRIDENVVALRCATPAGRAGHARRARERRRAGAARARASAPRARSA